MAGVLDNVDLRTQLAGHNRLELLLFKLGGRQTYGINVFKVQEVIRCPSLVQMPQSHPVIIGVAHLRGKTISVMDLGMAINRRPIGGVDNSFVIITEYNRYIQGFLVNSVDRIVNMNWKDILPPPKGSGAGNYLTAVTHVDNKLIEIIDVEKVLADIIKVNEDLSDEVIDDAKRTPNSRPEHVLVVDDSSVARNQVKRVLQKVGIECTMAKDGQEGLELLQSWAADKGKSVSEHIAMVISDIEMPRMDGYTMTTEIRKDPRLQNLHVLLHTSLSGVFNRNMVEKVGADDFIAKFKPNELAEEVLKVVHGGKEARDV